MKYTHKYCKGLTIEIISPTKKGFKVKQIELFTGWSDRKLRTPKVKTAFYSNNEIKELFNKTI